jgi:hypothetical protein
MIDLGVQIKKNALRYPFIIAELPFVHCQLKRIADNIIIRPAARYNNGGCLVFFYMGTFDCDVEANNPIEPVDR